MFNVIRPQPGPDCSKDIRSKPVVAALRAMFYGKCYLCEDVVSDPEVEHFIPREVAPAKASEWSNLYYSCHRCNSIKGNITNILDCCDDSVEVAKAVKCLCPRVPNENVWVEAQREDAATKNTAALLDRCYNEDNTGIREISREALHEKLFDSYYQFINIRRTLKSKDFTASEKAKAKEHLQAMLQDDYPFSIFWKWHTWSDSFLQQQ